jgi:hypothetical protein
MKKIVLFLFVYNLSIAQYQTIQIKLVDENIGSVNYYPGQLGSSGLTSNDVGLNQILSNYNVTEYYDGLGRPYINSQDFNKYKMIDCLNCNVTQLISDLVAYSSVVEKASCSPEQQTFSDILSFKLTDPTVGIATGISNNIVTTNSTILNQLFQTYTVYHYENFVSNASGAWYYNIICDCTISDLKNALLANNIIQPNTASSNNYSYQGVAHLLNNSNFNSDKTSVFPNPFSNNFNINTEELITNYSLVDISGKQLITTTSKNELDTISSQLNSGIYFLNIHYINGKIGNFKVVKE